jgi:hypothetical protein
MSLLVCNLLIVVPYIYLFIWRWRSKRNEEQPPENQQHQTLTELDQTGYLYSFWGAPPTMSTMILTSGDSVQCSDDPTSVTVTMGQMSISGSQAIVFADMEAISEVGVIVGARDTIEEHRRMKLP